MNATTNQEEEQHDEKDVYTADDILGGNFDPDDSEVTAEKINTESAAQMFEHAEYEIEVGRTTATDDVTGEQYTLWRAQGRPVGTTADGFREVSPNLPEAIMAVCEALERGDC